MDKYGIIVFNDTTYPYRYVNHKVGGVVMFSTNELDEALIKDGQYVNSEAEALDNKIYGFVDKDILTTYTDEDFEKYINENID